MSTTNGHTATPRPSPLAQLTAAEQTLVAQLHAVAERLDAVGTDAVSAALARVQASADAARARLSAAYMHVQDLVGGVLDHLDAAAGLLAGQLGADLASARRGEPSANFTEGSTSAAPTPAAPIAAPTTAPSSPEIPATLPTQEEIEAEGDGWREEMLAKPAPAPTFLRPPATMPAGPTPPSPIAAEMLTTRSLPFPADDAGEVVDLTADDIVPAPTPSDPTVPAPTEPATPTGQEVPADAPVPAPNGRKRRQAKR